MPVIPSQDIQAEYIAIGAVHILAARAVPLFPTSTPAHPSFWVTVQLLPNGALWPGAEKRFPHQVRWDIWRSVVVPVLKDDDNQFFPNNGADRNERTLSLLRAESHDELVGNIQSALVAQFQAVGLMPPEPASTEVLAPAAPGEPVDRTPTVSEEDEMYVRFDANEEPPVYTQFDVGGA